jgi:aerobic-type carbon monoxide dehydrogenase small subunit (CoxS/CutS family)
MSDNITLNVTVNGEARSVEIDPRRLLVEAIREELGLPGTHIGCLTGDCGACTVEQDGQIVKSCLALAASAEGSEITTIEGLAEGDGELSTLQQAFWDEYGFQCGYCLPGMLFSAKDLLAENSSPSEGEIRHAINGNLCRCTGYDTIVKSIAEAAARTAQ